MARFKRDPRLSRSVFTWRAYVGVFLMVAGGTTATALLLLFNGNVSLDEGFWVRALQAFGNVLFVSALFAVGYGIWWRLYVQRPVQRILEFTGKVSAGDFDTRVDLGARRRGADEFDVIAKDLNRMALELGGVETLRTDFVSSVSHEMKTPLAQITNYATLLQNPELADEERLDLARRCAQSSARLSDLITNVLRLNKLENQQIFPQHKEFDLSEQLRECVLGFENEWERKEIEIDAEGIADGVLVRSDPELLSLAWNNLLSNAFKYTETGGTVRVALAVTQEQERALVTVADTGCGMAPEVAAHAFDRFYQGDTSHASEGNGLGLALVRRVCDVCGAQVQLASGLGAGTTVTVALPNKQASGHR